MRGEVYLYGKFVEVSSGLGDLIIFKQNKEVSYQYNGHIHVTHTLYDLQWSVFFLYQGKYATYQDYIEIFNNIIMVLDQIEATVMGTDETLIEHQLKWATETNNFSVTKKAEAEAREGYFVMEFLQISDSIIYGYSWRSWVMPF